jgi:hypothetical protein
VVTEAYGGAVTAAIGVLAELNHQLADMEAELGRVFEQHPDARIVRSLPGLGVVVGARLLGEFGDDPCRYPDVKARRNYAGTSPITVASGKKKPLLPQKATRFLDSGVTTKLGEVQTQSIASRACSPTLPRSPRTASSRTTPISRRSP